MEENLLTKHPLVTGGIILGGAVVLYFYWKSGGTTSQSVASYSQPYDPTALQSQQLSLQSTLANKNLDYQYDVAKGTFDIQALAIASDSKVKLQALENDKAFKAGFLATEELRMQTEAVMQAAQIASSERINKVNQDAAVTMNSNNNNRDVTIAGYQLTATNNQIAANQAIQSQQITANQDIATKQLANDIEKAKIQQVTDIAAIGSNQTIQIAKIGATQEIADRSIDAQLTATNAAIGSNQTIEIAKIGAWQTIQNAIIGSNTNISQQILDLVNSGKLNKGGEGGANQVSAIAAITGQPAIAVAAQQGQAAVSTDWGNVVGNIGNGVKNVFTSLFGG